MTHDRRRTTSNSGEALATFFSRCWRHLVIDTLQCSHSRSHVQWFRSCLTWQWRPVIGFWQRSTAIFLIKQPTFLFINYNGWGWVYILGIICTVGAGPFLASVLKRSFQSVGSSYDLWWVFNESQGFCERECVYPAWLILSTRTDLILSEFWAEQLLSAALYNVQLR
jgi:hypothetical protein